MRAPIVYDVLLRIEVEATCTDEAIQHITDRIARDGLKKTVAFAFEVIRDDNAFPPKDLCSREVGGFSVLSSAQKHALLDCIRDALSQAYAGRDEPGQHLLSSLAQQFTYLDNPLLEGVQI